MIALLAGLGVTAGGIVGWQAFAQNQGSNKTATRHTAGGTPTSTVHQMGETLYRYAGHEDRVTQVVWSPDGKRIASGSMDGTVQVWNALTGAQVLTYRGHSGFVYAIGWSPDGQYIASGSADTTVQVWEAATGNPTFIYHGHGDQRVFMLAWSPDGQQIASGSIPPANQLTPPKILGELQVWNALSGAQSFSFQDLTNELSTLGWSPDGKKVVCGSFGGGIQVLEITAQQTLFTYPGSFNNFTYTVAWSPDGQRIASGWADNTVKVWDALTGDHALTFRGHSKEVLAVNWSPNGKRIASGSLDETVQVWDAATLGHVFVYNHQHGYCTTLAWSPDGKLIASGDGTWVDVWEAV